jgi:hypothetical protein
MLVLNNWDLKTINNKIVEAHKKGAENGDEKIYYVGDLGATFGKTGSLAHELHLPNHPPAGSKDKPGQYAQQSFINDVTDGEVRFHYKGKDPSAVRVISADNANGWGLCLVGFRTSSSPMHSARLAMTTLKQRP